MKPDLAKLAGPTAIAMALVCTGPAAHGQPTEYCDDQAREFADTYNSASRDVVGGALAGALGGAALGGAIGGKRKSVGRGALMGAGVGTAAAAADASGRWQQDYNYAFQRCMAATDRAKAPPAGTPAWLDYCAAKYRSFDPATGLYLSYSGSHQALPLTAVWQRCGSRPIRRP